MAGQEPHETLSPRSGVGAPPGTLRVPPSAEFPVVRVLAFDSDNYVEEEVADPSALANYLRRWRVTWVNIDGLGDETIIRGIGEVFGLHSLALEDAVHLSQRPKAEDYGNHQFFVLRMFEGVAPVRTEQVSLFLGKGLVVTFQEHAGDCLDPVRNRVRRRIGRVRDAGADYLAYCLIDAVIDGYFPCMDAFSEYTEDLEAEVLAAPTPDAVARIHQAKRDLLIIRRVMASMREALNALFHGAGSHFDQSTMVYLRDCYDHVIHILETVENHREIVGGLLDIYLTSVSNRMNETMKVLTIIATVFIPLTFIAGIYGMNFNPDVSPWNMPELKWYWGYPVLLLVMMAVAVVELFIFRKKGWLGGVDGETDRKSASHDAKEDSLP